MHNLASLVKHLHLLLGVSVVGEHVNLRNNVVGELMRELANSHRLVVNKLLVFLLQLSHSSRTGTTRTLIACDVDALDMTQCLKRLQHYNHHDSGAVRIGNNATWTVESISRVALRHNQRYIVAHAES